MGGWFWLHLPLPPLWWGLVPHRPQTGVGPRAGDPCSRRCPTFTLGRWACPSPPRTLRGQGATRAEMGPARGWGGAAGVGCGARLTWCLHVAGWGRRGGLRGQADVAPARDSAGPLVWGVEPS